MTTEMLISAILSVFTLLTSFSCATSPEGRKQILLMPDGQMNTLGAQSFTEMKSKIPVEKSATINAYVLCVSNAITDALPEKSQWELVVFQDDSANAFALPGGKIGVHTGLLKVATTPDQLAAVIGHEVGHVLAKHGNERVSQQLATQGGITALSAILASKGSQSRDMILAAVGVGAQYGVLMPWGRTQESEADIIGLELMAKAGFKPQESVTLWQNMGKASGGSPPEFLSTHPSGSTRIANLQKHMAEADGLYRASARKPICRP